MSSVGQAVLLSWSAPPAASFALAVTAIVYLRGWILMRRARVPFVPPWRAVSFLLGLLALWAALASPLDTFSSFLITAHMVQHMLLMMVAPPLILLGAPLIPLVRGLPAFAAREFAGPFLNWRVALRVGNVLTNLWFALVLMGVVMFGWHTPRLYELALASSSWHEFEHACFFVASLIFWWPVVQPWPSRAHAPRWAIVPYLLIGDVQNTALSAILIFSDRVLYPSYAAMPRLFGFSAQHDQAASGAIMWVMGSLAFLVPAVVIAVQCLSTRTEQEHLRRTREPELVHGEQLPASGGMAASTQQSRKWFGEPKRQAFTFIVLFAAVGLTLAALAAGSSDDDDQVLRSKSIAGDFLVSVFAPGGDLEAGANTFAVLVQNRSNNDVLRDATVDLQAGQRGGLRKTQIVRASTDPENKLLQSADVDLPTAGAWSLYITVRDSAESAEINLPLTVVKSETGFTLHWSYVVLVAFGAVLLIAYVWRHRAHNPVRMLHSPSGAESAKAENLF